MGTDKGNQELKENKGVNTGVLRPQKRLVCDCDLQASQFFEDRK